MIIGQSFTSIHDKGQVSIPTGLASDLTKRVFLTQGLDRNIMLFPESTFHNLTEQLQKLNLADPKARHLLRVFLASAIEVNLDATNQFEIPESLRKFACIESQTIFIGQGNYIEIWDPENWNKQELALRDVDTEPHRFNQFTINLG